MLVAQYCSTSMQMCPLDSFRGRFQLHRMCRYSWLTTPVLLLFLQVMCRFGTIYSIAGTFNMLTAYQYFHSECRKKRRIYDSRGTRIESYDFIVLIGDP